MKKILDLLPFAIVFIISFLVIYPTFKLSLWGDDWYVFWRSTRFLESKDLGNWNYLSLYFTAYGPMDVLVGTFMRYLYGLNSTYYYLTSFTFRVLASFSLYPLIMYLTKDKLAAFFAMLFFSITVIGMESTDIVVLTPSFIALIFLSFFLYFYLKARENENKRSYMFFAGSFFILAMATAPIRMTGLIPTILIIEIFWLYKYRSRNFVIKTIKRLALVLCLFLVIYNTNSFISIPTEVGQEATPRNMGSEQTVTAIKLMINHIKQGDSGFLLTPIIITGGMLLPSLNSLPNTDNLNSLKGYVGILMIIVGIVLMRVCSRNKYLPDYILLSLALTIFGFIIPWMWSPTEIYTSSHRYLITSAVGISLFLSLIIGLTKVIKFRVIIILLLSLFFISHIISSHGYIKLRLSMHNQLISNKLWSQIPYIPELGKTDKPIVFYMYSDKDDGGVIGTTLFNNFNYHMGFLYNLNSYKKMPVVMGRWDGVLSAVKDGEEFRGNSLPAEPTPIDHVYGFVVKDKDNVINITEKVREELRRQTIY